MNIALNHLFWLIVPGFIGTVAVGLIASYFVRKVSALVQWRIGPPIMQPFYDVVKLMGKETLIPEDGNRMMFIFAPLAGFAGVLLLSTMLLHIIFLPQQAFVGDVIVAVYLLVFPSLALILGSSASASTHAAIGTSREMKMVIGYELPLLLSLIVVLVKTGGALGLATIAENAHVLSISGFIGFIVSLLCVQAKLGFVPFDIAESETELAGGVLIEYSGALLGIWKIMQAMMLVALPLFLQIVFLGGFDLNSGGAIAASIGKYVVILVLIILIKNTNPRVRIDQAMRFFWLYCGLLAAVAVVLAMVGQHYEIGWL